MVGKGEGMGINPYESPETEPEKPRKRKGDFPLWGTVVLATVLLLICVLLWILDVLLLPPLAVF